MGLQADMARLAGEGIRTPPSDERALSALEVQTNRIFRAVGIMDDEEHKDDVRNRLMHEVDDMVTDARYKGVTEGLKDGALSQQKETDEAALCGIVAMWGFYGRTPIHAHAPVIFSRIAFEAVVSKLMELGYTPDGKMNKATNRL